jgi:ribosomal protein L6P/L9E
LERKEEVLGWKMVGNRKEWILYIICSQVQGMIKGVTLGFHDEMRPIHAYILIDVNI